MTEQEWLECDDPRPMLGHLQGKVSDRKLRLFAVACCRNIWHLVTDKRSRRAVEIAEKFADGLISDAELLVAGRSAINATHDIEESKGINSAAEAVCCAVGPIHGIDAAAVAHFAMTTEDEAIAQCDLLHDIFGNPFRPITIDPRWLTSTVVDLATAIYQEKAFGRMPLLADALMDAGCDDKEIITHCRGDGPHVLGCWVIDLLLGKQ